MRKRLWKSAGFFMLIFVCYGFSMYAVNQSALSAYSEGCKAYSRGDWDSCVFLLKKAAAYQEFNTADTQYMLITAEIYSGDEQAALSDCDSFLVRFPGSLYEPRILYTKGKLLFNAGNLEESVIVLSDFCNRFSSDYLYPSALFYIAEALYSGYKYDGAEELYERIITEFPESDKVPASQYRLDSIAQRSREEKLLYLLRQTGEEYLAAKEDYEKQLRLYNSEAINTTRERLSEAQARNRDLEEQISELETQLTELKDEQARKALEGESVISRLDGNPPAMNNEEVTAESEVEATVRMLKEKALEIQLLLDSRKD